MKHPRVPSDNPIKVPSEDALGRGEAAESFAQHVLDLDATEGAVVGVFGPWGSGKTSFLNLAKHKLNTSAYILDFNPWLFSGTEHLVHQFFAQLSDQALRLKDLRRIGQGLREYGAALKPAVKPLKWFLATLLLFLVGVIGPTGEILGVRVAWIVHLVALLTVGALYLVPPILNVVGLSLLRRQGSVFNTRARVESALSKSDKRIIVVLDDVDRLTPTEIREIFKLVRLTASFPKLIYILACDRTQVTDALGEQGSGYLEKIIQHPFNLPEVPRHTLRQQLQLETVQALGDIRCGSLDADIWRDVLRHIVMPLIRNMRDVRRYGGSIRETISALGDHIELADVLGLEAIRLFLPQVFDLLPASIDALTFPPIMDAITDEGHINLLHVPVRSSEGDEIVEIGQLKTGLSERHQEVIESMCEFLFPATRGERFHYTEPREQAFQGSRVACRSILRVYLERFYDEEVLALSDAERALKCMHDAHALRAIFQEFDAGRWPYIVTHLSGFAKERYRPEQIETGLTVLWNLQEFDAGRWPYIVTHLSGFAKERYRPEQMKRG